MSDGKLKLKLRTAPRISKKSVPVGAGKKSASTQTRSLKRSDSRNDPFLNILIVLAIFSVALYCIMMDWPQLKNVDVRGSVNLTSDEVIALAALDDFSDAWAISIPREKLENTLESYPFIESARISLTGPTSIRIRVTERRPLAALEHNGMHFIFDRSGEFIEILNPSENISNPVCEGVPLGLLKYGGEPFRNMSGNLMSACADVETMEIRFNRLMHLTNLVRRGYPKHEYNLEKLSLDNDGGIVAYYGNCPPFILGNLANTGMQYRRMTAMLNNGQYLDPEEISDIDLSSEQFPCYHVQELSTSDAEAVTEWHQAANDAVSAEAEFEGEIVSEDEEEKSEWVETDDDEDEPIHDSSIFNLGSG